MSYEELDTIADAYIPLLAFLTIIWFLYDVFQTRINSACYKKVFLNISTTFMGVLVIYTFMFLDMKLNIFPMLGLDYSTHTALALVFIVTLSCINKQAMWVAVISILLYCALMMYQKYHTFYDILVTAILVLPPLIGLKYLSNKKMLNKEVNDD